MNAPPNGPLYRSDTNEQSTINQIGASYGGPAARFSQAVMMPAVVQSASTSPAMAIDVDCGHLPHFHDDIWARPPAAPVSRASQHMRQHHQSSTECDSPIDTRHGYNRYGHPERQQAAYPTQQTDQQMDYAPPHPAYSSPTAISSESPYYHHRQQNVPSAATRAAPVAAAQGQGVPIPSAPFANAGPPGVGVQFYPTPSQSSTYPSPLPHPYGYTCPYNPRQGGHASWVRMRNGVGCWSGLVSYRFLLPFLFFLPPILVYFFARLIFLIREFYDGGIPMLTTFPFYRANFTLHQHHSQYHIQIHCYYYYNSAYILLQSFIPISLAFLLALSFHFTFLLLVPPFFRFNRLPHMNYISTLGISFFFQSAICNHNTYFRPTNHFWYPTSQRNLALHKHHYWYITSEKNSYSFN